MALRKIASLWVSKAGQKSKLNGNMDGPNRTKGPRVYVIPNEGATAENRKPQYRLVVEEADAEQKPRVPYSPDDEGNFQHDDDVPF